jgi:hypothetical protein
MKQNTPNRTQQGMNRNWNNYDSREQTAADDRERNLERAIVIGALLILALAAAVFCWKFATVGKATDGGPTLEIQTPTYY